MKVTLTCVPAIHLGDEAVVPQRRTWDVTASDAELDALKHLAETVAERAAELPLDREHVRVLASAIEIVQLVAQREG